VLRSKDLEISKLLGEIQHLKRENLGIRGEVDVLHHKVVTSEREARENSVFESPLHTHT
jgi:hypothetical protein